MNDTLGKDGLEKAYESYLRGTDGTRAVQTNLDGYRTGIIEVEEPKPGNNVITTIDLDLQAVAEESLASTIADISQKSNGRDVEGGP